MFNRDMTYNRNHRVPLKTLEYQGKVEGEIFKGGENRGKG